MSGLSGSIRPDQPQQAQAQQALDVLKNMGFPEAACSRALTACQSDVNRALNWLLANPAEVAASGQPIQPVIYTMGFEEALVAQALRQAGGNEQLAINLLLNGEVENTASAAPGAAPVAPGDDRMIFSMGFEPELVRRALVRARNAEDAALELLLSGALNGGSDEEVGEDEEVEEDEEDDEGGGDVPDEWTAMGLDPEFFTPAMIHCIDIYIEYCESSLSGGIHPHREHHVQFLLSNMSSTRADFMQQLTPGLAYRCDQHVEFMIRTFHSRHPGMRRIARGSFILNIDRERVVDSTVDQLGSLPDNEMPHPGEVTVQFIGQSGYDAGGLTDDWLSSFMLDAMNPFREPPLFLLPKQIDGMKEACCLRLNHSLHAFGVAPDRERAIMRTFGYVLGFCLRKGRYASNKYMLSKSLLQRLLSQELPPGLLGLKEEFPEEYQSLEDLRLHPEYFEMAEKKYMADSRISDFYDLQRFLQDCIGRIEVGLQKDSTESELRSASAPDRVALRDKFISETVAECFARGVDGVKAIKTAFFHKNEELPKGTQFHAANSGEIRAKLRELRGEAVSSEPLSRIAQCRRLILVLHNGEQELKRLRDERSKEAADSDYMQSVVRDVPSNTDVTASNFEAYCADVVQKRLETDVSDMLQCMRGGFMALYQPVEYDALKLMPANDLQHKLFPLDPVTAESFKKNSRFSVSPSSELFWSEMEKLSAEQVQNVFYFATNWHTLSDATRKVQISFEKRDHKGDIAPTAATCNWSLTMPDCFWRVDGGKKSDEAQERMRQALLIAASPQAQGYGFG